MEFIRWDALSSYVRWFELLEERGYQTCSFNHNLPHVALAWAKEKKFEPKTSNFIHEIGLEKITQFKPDVIFCRSPFSYLENKFLDELLSLLNKKPKLVAWYGANSGNEKIFRNFDLTLSNSKYLVNSLIEKNIKANFLQHAFDPIILEKIKIPAKRINRVAFFGNIDVSTRDFRDRTHLLEQISDQTNILDVYGAKKIPTLKETSKYFLLNIRHKIASSINQLLPNTRLDYWANIQN